MLKVIKIKNFIVYKWLGYHRYNYKHGVTIWTKEYILFNKFIQKELDSEETYWVGLSPAEYQKHDFCE